MQIDNKLRQRLMILTFNPNEKLTLNIILLTSSLNIWLLRINSILYSRAFANYFGVCHSLEFKTTISCHY